MSNYDTWKQTDPRDVPTRSTGPRREPEALCYSCGKPMSDEAVSLHGSYCSGDCLAASIDRVSQR